MGSEDNIGLDSTPWLRTSIITGRLDKNSFDMADLSNIVGSGEAVGGMVSAGVGRVAGQEPTQLQRIVSRCSCEFYFVSFSPDLDPVAEEYAANISVSLNVCCSAVSPLLLIDVERQRNQPLTPDAGRKSLEPRMCELFKRRIATTTTTTTTTVCFICVTITIQHCKSVESMI